MTATAGDGRVTIAWSRAPTFVSYNLYWSVTPGVDKADNSNFIEDVTRPFTHKSFSTGFPQLPGGTYYYAVTVMNTSGDESPLSAEVSATVAPAKDFVTDVIFGQNPSGLMGELELTLVQYRYEKNLNIPVLPLSYRGKKMFALGDKGALVPATGDPSVVSQLELVNGLPATKLQVTDAKSLANNRFLILGPNPEKHVKWMPAKDYVKTFHPTKERKSPRAVHQPDCGTRGYITESYNAWHTTRAALIEIHHEGGQAEGEDWSHEVWATDESECIRLVDAANEEFIFEGILQLTDGDKKEDWWLFTTHAMIGAAESHVRAYLVDPAHDRRKAVEEISYCFSNDAPCSELEVDQIDDQPASEPAAPVLSPETGPGCPAAKELHAEVASYSGPFVPGGLGLRSLLESHGEARANECVYDLSALTTRRPVPHNSCQVQQGSFLCGATSYACEQSRGLIITAPPGWHEANFSVPLKTARIVQDDHGDHLVCDYTPVPVTVSRGSMPE